MSGNHRRETREEEGEKLYKCSVCGFFKSRSMFPKAKDMFDGVASKCNVCVYGNVLRWREKNPTYARDKKRDYRRGNRGLHGSRTQAVQVCNG